MASHSQDDRTPKSIGSTWITPYERELWPAVLCSDELPPPAFIQSRSPGNKYPAILLGKHKFVWVADDKLTEFDPSKDYLEGCPKFENYDVLATDDDEVKVQKQRHNAFASDAMQFRDHVFWNNYIRSRSEARKLEQRVNGKHERSYVDDMEIVDFRRSSSASTASSKRRRRDDGTRLPRRGHHYLTPEPTPKKGGRFSKGVVVSIESDDESQGRISRPSKMSASPSKSRNDSFFSDPEVKEEDEVEAKERREQNMRERNMRNVMRFPPSDNRCTIFVGESGIPFEVPREAIGDCEYLNQKLFFTDELKSHIKLFGETYIDDQKFMPISEYLRNGDFAPRLIESGTIQRLENVVMEDEKDAAAVAIAKVYISASTIQFGQLQSLCVDKLKVLYPLGANNLLIVITLISRTTPWECEAEEDVREWLVDHVAHHFWHLVQTESSALSRLMMANDTLRKNVIAKLAEDPTIGMVGMDLE